MLEDQYALNIFYLFNLYFHDLLNLVFKQLELIFSSISSLQAEFQIIFSGGMRGTSFF